MTRQTSILNDADLEAVNGGSKIGDAAQKVSGLFKAASDIGQAVTQQPVYIPAAGDLLAGIGHGH